MSEEQIILHNYATEAVKSGDYEKAQQLLKASSMLGKNNILWYEQGKVYAKLNRCQEAYDAYHHVANAPVLYYESHPPETILKKKPKRNL